jgi:hypothetical protein
MDMSVTSFRGITSCEHDTFHFLNKHLAPTEPVASPFWMRRRRIQAENTKHVICNLDFSWPLTIFRSCSCSGAELL